MSRPRSAHGDRHQHAVLAHTTLQPRWKKRFNDAKKAPTILQHRPISIIPGPEKKGGGGTKAPRPLVGNQVPGQIRCPEGVYPSWWPEQEINILEADFYEQVTRNVSVTGPQVTY